MNKNSLKNANLIGNRTLILFQAIAWGIFLLCMLLYSVNKWAAEPFVAVWNVLISTTSYAISLYANFFFFWKKYANQGKNLIYSLVSIVFISLIVWVRVGLEYKVLFPNHKVFYDFTLPQITLSYVTITLAFLIGGFLQIMIEYWALRETQKELRRQQVITELNLLKAQVQPHFLFNTLNNIYSLAVAKSEKTPETIARLSEIMRYFVDDAPKEKVSIKTEINFLQHYIELEQIRMVNPLKLDFKAEIDDTMMLSPMLFIPIIENIFKHGIDKTRNDNFAKISIKATVDEISLEVKNSISTISNPKGFGLNNLKQRLELLYPQYYRLNTQNTDNQFITILKINPKAL